MGTIWSKKDNTIAFKLYGGQARSYINQRNIYSEELGAWVKSSDQARQIVHDVGDSLLF
jgi:hypothetical protein